MEEEKEEEEGGGIKKKLMMPLLKEAMHSLQQTCICVPSMTKYLFNFKMEFFTLTV